MTQSSRPEPTAVPLSLVARGETVVIRQINGGGRLRQRLFDLGLNQGARVRVVQNELPGPLILAVKEDGRLALGRGMTHRILVTPVANNNHSGER
jgi:ferrous iron transport protein A